MASTACDSSQLGVIRPAYMSLPSPNIHSAEDEKKKVMEDQAWQSWNTGYETEGEEGETSSTLLERRGALVPPKMGMGGVTSGRESSCSR